jgi:antitoxin HigA-1
MWTHPEAHPGEYLRRRFLEPLGLSAADLARGCRMPRSRVSDILTGKRAITADTAVRLAAYFRMEAEAWMALQADWDLQQAAVHDSIVPVDPVGFLLGPLGATPLPARRRASPPHLRIPDRGGRGPAHTGAAAERDPMEHEEVRYPDGTRALVARHG